MEVAELKGYKSYRAFVAFHNLMLGLKMTPLYISEKYYEWFENNFVNVSEDEKRKMVRDAALFVNLEPEEIEVFACLCKDKNGIPYSKANIGNLKPDEILEVIISVCMEIGKIKIDMLTREEKKN